MEEFGHGQATPPNALQIVKTFLYVGFVGFEGSLAILAHLRRAVVETERG